MGGDGDGETDLERKQSEERLEPGLWFSILALPPQRFSRRRRVRTVLPGDAGPGRGGGDHQRCQRYAGRAERDLGQTLARDATEKTEAEGRYRRQQATDRKTLASRTSSRTRFGDVSPDRQTPEPQICVSRQRAKDREPGAIVVGFRQNTHAYGPDGRQGSRDPLRLSGMEEGTGAAHGWAAGAISRRTDRGHVRMAG